MKRWLQIAVVFITMLAPVAAWADLAYEGPPNDYIFHEGTLRRLFWKIITGFTRKLLPAKFVLIFAKLSDRIVPVETMRRAI